MQYASGQISDIMVWDLDREQLLSRIPSHSDSCVSAMVSFSFQGSLIVGNCVFALKRAGISDNVEEIL